MMKQLFWFIFKGKTPQKQKKSGQRKTKHESTTPKQGMREERHRNKTVADNTNNLLSLAYIASKGLSLSTRQNYLTAVRSFASYNNTPIPTLAHLTSDNLKHYESWLRKKSVCPNTSSCYMRSLRAIYNKSTAKHRNRHDNPFKNVFTGNAKTEKRNIGLREIKQLQCAKAESGSPVELARNLFLFSLYAMGISFIDMAHLKKSNIKAGKIVFHRHKTGKQVCVKLEKCMTDIIAQYSNPNTDALFPILYKEKSNSLRPQNYATALNTYNRSLKALARNANLKTNLTSYTPRHSWASMAYNQNISLPIISKALGHTDTKTTLIYIADINDKRIALANKKLLRELNCIPLSKRYVSN